MSTPIKRIEALKPLSREHHHGLLFCWKLKMGVQKNISVERMQKFALWFYQAQLQQHFESEENYLFPILGSKNKLVKQAISEHRRISELFNSITFTFQTFDLIQSELDHHIRFEERMLFDKIQRIADQAQLQLLDDIHVESLATEQWEDKFWE